MKYLLVQIFILTFISTSCQDNNERLSLQENEARIILKETLNDTTLHNVIGQSPILESREKAIALIEPILFDIYGKKNIESQRPYDAFNIDNYWLICGTLPKGKVGGTFMIIIDFRDCRIIRLTHGK